MSVDSSELDELAHDFGLVPARLVKKVRPIMAKTGLATKQRLQKDMRRSKHFKQIAPTIDYDLRVNEAFGVQVIEVEVGPNKSRGGGRAIGGMGSMTGGSAASLAGIAYFGTSRAGGATVPDPIIAMRQEEPVLLGYLQMAVEDLL